MAFQIAGNAVANNARLRLTNTRYQNSDGQYDFLTYTNATGVYTFTAIPAGTYQLTADLNEVTAAPYNTGYRFPGSVIVTMDAAGDNLVDVNFQPVLKNASNQGLGQPADN
jgi:hypothetical protein